MDFEIANSNSKIISRNIENEMEKSFLDYSMSVIVSRALPDVRTDLSLYTEEYSTHFMKTVLLLTRRTENVLILSVLYLVVIILTVTLQFTMHL